MGTHIARGTSMAHDLGKKAAAYGMPAAACDGMDVLAVYDCFRPLVQKVRSGGGPVFVDVQTYRYMGHSMSDPQKYRSKQELSAKQEADPIALFSSRLIEADVASQQQVDELDDQAKQTARDAIKYASHAPDPPAEELYTDVYAQPYGPFRRGQPPIMFDHPHPSAD
jgi:pyruvate dehydrogenase E1 component alpha subunit